MKRVMLMGLCMLTWSTGAWAACQATIIASTPTAAFTANGNGTVTHVKTGLMWKRCSEGQVWNGTTCAGAATTYTWQIALNQAKTVNTAGFAGFTDWRVPNKKELASIVEIQCVTPSINATIFPATVSGWYWSSSPYAGSATFAWFVGFNGGGELANFKSNNNYVRLVRGGQ